MNRFFLHCEEGAAAAAEGAAAEGAAADGAAGAADGAAGALAAPDGAAAVLLLELEPPPVPAGPPAMFAIAGPGNW